MFNIKDSSSKIFVEQAFPRMKSIENDLKKNPNSPLIKSPYFRFKLEAKNLDYNVKNIEDVRPYIKITLGTQELRTK